MSSFRHMPSMPLPFAAKAFLPFLLILLTGCSINKALRVEDRTVVDVPAMIGGISGARIIFVGEAHDAGAHHELQLRVLEALKAQGKHLAIGMEMFEQTSQPALDAWGAGKVPEAAFRKVYALSWRYIPWEMYADIFHFAKENHIPIVGLNAPRELVQAVARRGFADLSKEELAQLPPGTDARVSENYLRFMRGYSPSHGKDAEGFRNIAEAQMLRNVMMARRIETYLGANPDRVMVVIAGGAHVRGVGGIPSELRGGLSYRIVLPPMPPLNQGNVTREDADYLLIEPF